MHPDSTIATDATTLTEETVSQLDGRALAAVDHYDITDVPPQILHMLQAESIMTRQELADALLAAEPSRRTLATVMLLESISDGMKQAMKNT